MVFDVKEYYRKYYHEHKEQYAKAIKKYRSKTGVKERIRIKHLEWLSKNPGYNKNKLKEYYYENKKKPLFVLRENERKKLYKRLRILINKKQSP